MKVKDMMTPNAKAILAYRKFGGCGENHVGKRLWSAAIVKDRKVVGMITDRDICISNLAGPEFMGGHYVGTAN